MRLRSGHLERKKRKKEVAVGATSVLVCDDYLPRGCDTVWSGRRFGGM